MPEFVKRNVIVFVYSALILSTLLVFWQVREFDFVGYDDNEYIYENPHVYSGLTADAVIWAFTASHASNWHPLTWISHMLDCELFGKNPGPMHVVNLFLHFANTLLLFAILKKMTTALWPSAFVAAAFALHPMHVESVAWIAERKDVLSTLLWLLTMLTYVRYAEKPIVSRYVITLIFFVLGLMSKPMLVTLPFVLLLIDYWPLNRISNKQPAIRNLILEKIPFFALVSVSSVITFLAQRAGGAVAGIDVLALKNRIANAFLSYARYIGKLFWPQDLAVFYTVDVRTIQFWQAAMSFVLLIVITVLVIRFGRNRKYLPVGWFWFVGTLVPVIGLVQVGAAAYADRYTYIPYIGLFIMLAWGLPELLSNLQYRKFILGTSAAIVLTTLGTIAYRQVSFWNNSITLFSHAIDVTHNNTLAYYNLGTAYLYLGRYQDAIQSFRQAIRIMPNYANAHYNLGFAYARIDRYQDAIEAYQRVLRIKPDLMKAYIDLGAAYRSIDRFQDAVETYQRAVRIKPDFAEAYVTLGVTYDKLGRIEDAIDSWRQALRIKPDYAEVFSNLGAAFYKLGRYQEAIESLKQAVKIKPDYVDAHSNLGTIYLAAGDKASAFEEYKILKTLDAKQAELLYNLIHK